jgi:hypothetical protein
MKNKKEIFMFIMSQLKKLLLKQQVLIYGKPMVTERYLKIH